MTSLQQALQSTPAHLIAIIGRAHGLGIDSNLPKNSLIEQVIAHLTAPGGRLLRFVDALPDAPRRGLIALQQAGPRLPARYLAAQYGPVCPNRRLIAACRHNEALSPLDTLRAAGLLYLDAAAGDLFIPADLIPLLPPAPLPTPPPPLAPPLNPIHLLQYDLTLLLALLHHKPIRPLHGRWLPPRLLADWGRLCRHPLANPQAAGELQTARRRFIHYLAENAGFITPAPAKTPPAATPALLPSPAAWLWLQADAPAQRRALWQSWLQPDPARWRIYRLPGHRWLSDPARLLQPLHAELLTLDPADPTRFAHNLLARRPALLDLLPANHTDRPAQLTRAIAHLLAGPLCWLGVLHPATETAAAPLRLTPQGQAWLENQPAPADAFSPARFSLTSQLQPQPRHSTLTLTLADGLPRPLDLMTALTLGQVSPPAGDVPAALTITLTAATFIAAIQRDQSPAGLLAALNQLAERPLTGPETALLRGWAAAAHSLTLRPAMLLQTTDPHIITRLAATRRGRSHIQETLSPRAVTVDPARLPLLARRLTEQEGFPPYLSGGVGAQGNGEENYATEAAHLWLTVEVYRQLSRFIDLPARLPQVVIDDVQRQLTPTAQAAADAAARQTVAALQQAIDGQAAFAPWFADGLPVADSRALIERALAAGQPLSLHYYAAGTDTLTHRIVEPYRLEQRGDTLYLIAFCRRAQAQRTFRLDRIKQINLLTHDEPEDSGPVIA